MSGGRANAQLVVLECSKLWMLTKPSKCLKCGNWLLEDTEDGWQCVICGWIVYKGEGSMKLTKTLGGSNVKF